MGSARVAGVTRARALRTRCLGADGVREVAACRTLDDALHYLTATAYRHDVTPGGSLAEAQRAVSATLLWHLRILAGWQSADGADTVRVLAAGFEISNTEGHLRTLVEPDPDQHVATAPDRERREGNPSYPNSLSPGRRSPPTPYRLGALATAWARLVATRSPSETRSVLASSLWGDPGGDSPAAVATGMRVSAAVRLAAAVPEAARWAAGRLALLVGRERFVVERAVPEVSVLRAARLLGPRAVRAQAYAEFRQALPPPARWALEGTAEAADLWRAEARWWTELDRDGRELLSRSRFGSAPVVGAVAVLSADAWHTRAALVLASRGGGPVDRLGEVLGAPG